MNGEKPGLFIFKKAFSFLHLPMKHQALAGLLEQFFFVSSFFLFHIPKLLGLKTSATDSFSFLLSFFFS